MTSKNLNLYPILLALIISACQKSSGEGQEEEFSYHLAPFNYTSDEAKTMTGVCFSFTKEIVESSPSLKDRDVQEGPCQEQADIAHFYNGSTIETRKFSECEPYSNDGTHFSKLFIYDVSYDHEQRKQIATSEETATKLCNGQEFFARLMVGFDNTEPEKK